MVTQEGQPASSSTPLAKIKLSVQNAETGMNRDRCEPLRDTNINAFMPEETKQCSPLNQNTDNGYPLPPTQVCASQDNVKMEFIPDLPKSTQEDMNDTGISVIEKLRNSEHDQNGFQQFRCPSLKDNHNSLTSGSQIVTSLDVCTGALSKDVTTSEIHRTSPCPSLVLLPESSTTSTKPLPVPSPSCGKAERPRIIKHKPSSITFADYDCALGFNQVVHESSDCGESSSEEDEDDDVFTEMTQNREFHPGCRHRSTVRRKGMGGGGDEKVCNGDVELDSALRFSTSTGYEAEEENSSREVNAIVYVSCMGFGHVSNVAV